MYLESSAQSLSERVEYLFETIKDEHGQAYTNVSMARRIEALIPGFTVSPANLWNIRRGLNINPSWRILEGLRRVFGVPPEYFDDGNEITLTREREQLIASIHRPKLHELLLTSQFLSDDNLILLQKVATQFQRAEQRDEAEHESDEEPEPPVDLTVVLAPRQRGKQSAVPK